MSDWKEFSIGEIADPKDRYSFSGGPFGSNLKSSEYTEGGVRIVQLQNIGDGQFKDDYKIYTSEEKADELLSCNIYPGEIILSKMGDPVARATLIPDFEGRYLMASDGIRLKVDSSRFDPIFILNAINSPQFRNIAEAVSVGSTRKRIGLATLKELTIYAPPLPEQKKIAEILSGIENLITQRERRHEVLCDLLKSLVSEVDQYGEATDSGAFICNPEKIPSDWMLLPFRDLLGPVMEKFTLSDSNSYSPVIVRRRHAGIETRETKSGAKILVKDQFTARENCFLISKRQVIHGSTGLVPKNLGKNPIISKEYLQLAPLSNEVLDIKFMDFYSRSSLFHESIRMSVYGVDIEKYVFKDETWYSKKMLVPPLAVQKLISDSFSSIQEALDKNSSVLSKLRDLKIAVATDLLSGHKRFNI